MNSEHVKKYVALCGAMCQKAEDYTAPKVRKHNKAVQALTALQEELRGRPETAKEVYAELLEHESTYVRFSAAADCLKLGIFEARSENILEQLRAQGDRMTAMSADRFLRIWKGELDPTKPF